MTSVRHPRAVAAAIIIIAFIAVVVAIAFFAGDLHVPGDGHLL